MDLKHQALKQERERARELRREIASLRADVRRLSSINEVLLAESAALRSRLGDQKVVATVNLRKEPHRGMRAPFFEAAAKRKHDSRGEPSVRLSALPFSAEYRILARGTSGSSNHHTTFPL